MTLAWDKAHPERKKEQNHENMIPKRRLVVQMTGRKSGRYSKEEWAAAAEKLAREQPASKPLPALRTAASHRRQPDPEAFTEANLRELTPNKPLPVRGAPYVLRSTGEDGTHKGLVKLGWSRKKNRRNGNVKNPERITGPEFEDGATAEDVLQDRFDARWDFDEWYRISWEDAVQYLQSEEFRLRVLDYIKAKS